MSTISKPLKIHYDAQCPFCTKGARRFKNFLLLKNVSLIPAQNDPEIYDDMQSRNSWIVEDEKGNRFYRFRAVIALCEISPIFKYFVPILRLKLISFLGRLAYESVSAHRCIKPICKPSQKNSNSE